MTTQFERPLKSDSNQQQEKIAPPGLRQNSEELSSPPMQPNLPSSSQKNKSLRRWFYNLPIKNKLLAGLFVSGIVSVGGLTGVGTVMLLENERGELHKHAKTELEVTKINYDTKVDQMGFDFLGKADDSAIIEITRNHAGGQPLNPKTLEQVKQLLRSEIKEHNIEYLTLVGNDLRIIANANANRAGEKFDPNGLVSSVLKNQSQIKTNAIVAWTELQKEAPVLPKGFRDRDALIRYTATPIRDPNSGAVIGVLVSGDIVNGKLPIVQDTLQVVDDGYSAIYQRQSPNQFDLVTSLKQQQGKPETATPNLELSNKSILEKAAANVGESVTDRIKIGTQTYTVAAKALPDFNGQPTAVLVRGTPEEELNSILKKSLTLQGIVVAIVALVNIFLGRILGLAIALPLKQLKKITEKFASGDRQARAKIDTTDEIGHLATSFNQMADGIVAREKQLAEQAHRNEAAAGRSQVLNQIVAKIQRSLKEQEILNTAVSELRYALKCDRAIVYRFDEQWLGTIIAESVAPGFPVALGAMIPDPCFAKGYVEKYKQGRVQATENIYTAGLTDCHLNQLQTFQVKANIVAPILVGGDLLGLLICHQCSSPRAWKEVEIDLLRQVAVPLGFTLEQAYLLQQREQAQRQAEALTEQQRHQKEALQTALLDLLSNIEGAVQGDLTVRADVTADEIGTVADFFNSIVESLRHIVTQVKQSALQVNISLGENEGAMRQLAEVALKQSEETGKTLDSVEQMTTSIQAVADSARHAALVAKTASSTAQDGAMAMDLTVQNILNLRDTISETAKKVKRLGEASQQISKVISLINQIAMQTNLLAINAGIEAARAGEEGQGFAVVAEEVGALAARSAAATGEIERIVEDIQRETAQVVAAMETSTTQVVEGTKLVGNTKQSLAKILEVSRQIDQLVQSISGATVSQVQTAETVASLIREIAIASEHTWDSSLSVSHSLRETVEIAQELQTSVGTFKVS
jgi:twitching motility protein PilJ